MEGNNSLLTALAIVERIEPQLNPDNRLQLERNNLISIQRALMQAISNINNVDLVQTQISYVLMDIDRLITELLDDTNFVATDIATKEIIVTKLQEVLRMLYIEAGKYYDVEHAFNYSMRLNGLLERIIDACIADGYYFGQE